jgi:hypothetical protein
MTAGAVHRARLLADARRVGGVAAMQAIDAAARNPPFGVGLFGAAALAWRGDGGGVGGIVSGGDGPAARG